MDNLPTSFIDLLKSCTFPQKKAMLVHLSNEIKSEAKCTPHVSINYSQYVDHAENFVPKENFDEEILADVTSLGLIKKTGKVVTQWLSMDSREYCFSESQRQKHKPKPINDYPGIKNLLDRVNADPRTTQNLNAALISVYNSKNSALSFHHDGEHLMDSNASIAVVSFGATRTMEFCHQGPRPHIAEHTFKVCNHDLVIMKPGCQQALLHCIRSDDPSDANDVEELRFSISFRKVVPDTEEDPEVSFDINSQHQISGSRSPATQKINIVVGDSISAGLNEDKLGRKGRQLVKNLSSGGATIRDVCKQLDNFYVSNNVPVSKIFVCVGANDIRNCREKGVRHLKSPLNDLAKQIRLQFPSANVWFQSIIPFPMQHHFTIQNILEFNDLLYETCMINNMYYIDCVEPFLGPDGFRSEYLFHNRDNIHPNNRGLSVLAKIYLRLIHSRKFNPLGY